LTKIGKPIPSAAPTSSSGSDDGADDARTGTPADRAAVTALTLLPAIDSTRAGGPMNVIPASAHALASSGFSDRNP
jgi:hypothetical protein